MGSPRIVEGKQGSNVAFVARGEVLGEAFEIGVTVGDAGLHSRFKIEDRLLEEASGLIREAELAGSFDWAAQRFERKEGYAVWRKVLSGDEFQRLMQ